MSKRICKLQSTGITIDGAVSFVKPCCHFDVHKTLDLPDISEIQNFEEVLNSNLTKWIKKQTKRSRISQCDTCWDRESRNLQSRRLYFNEKLEGNSNTVENLQIALDYTCNLMCRICAPKHSSKWNSAKNVLTQLKEITRKPIYSPIPRGKNYSQNLKRVIENSNLTYLKVVELIGGEPFYSKHFNWFFDTIDKKANLENIEFICVTNGTIFPAEETVKKIKKFKGANIKLSIDAIGNLAESTRYGVDWHTIDKNIRQWAKLQEETDYIAIRANPTVSILNVNKMQEVIDYFDQFNIRVIPHGLIGPEWLCLEQIPLEIRQKWTVDYWHPEQKKQMNNLICSTRKVRNYLHKFLASNKVLDNHYGLTFADNNVEIQKLAERFAINYVE